MDSSEVLDLQTADDDLGVHYQTAYRKITVAPDRDSSIVTYEAELKLNGPLRLADPILALMFRRIGDRAATGLVEALGGARVKPDQS